MKKIFLSLFFSLFLVSFVSGENNIKLPAGIKTIYNEAFRGVPINSIDLPEGLEKIGSRSFAYTGIKSVFIPASVTSISNDAFEGCADLEPIVVLDSYADTWCEENGYSCWRTRGLGVASHTQKEIRQFTNSFPVNLSEPVTYKQKPTVDPYASGIVSDESVQNGLNMMNQYRYIAGLNADVTNYPEWEKYVNAAALVNALNGSLSHNPERPAELEDSIYDSLYNNAITGASSSNLFGGWDSLNLAHSIESYMDDSDESNITRVGHRRWILNPSMKYTAFGYCSLDSDDNSWWNPSYSAMYSFDTSGSGKQAPVAWPAMQTPIGYFYSSHAWSVSFGYRIDADKIRVKIERRSDGRIWNFSSNQADGDFYIDNNGYGQIGCVIFRPSAMGSINPGDVYDVTITDESNRIILNYSITFFDL